MEMRLKRAFDGVVEQIGSNGGFELGIGEQIDQHGGMQSGFGQACSCGWIMPAPLAIPATRTVTPSTSKSAAAIFGRVSVVMMAPAICCR